jgi:hypothetical protein
MQLDGAPIHTDLQLVANAARHGRSHILGQVDLVSIAAVRHVPVQGLHS